jgi:hypothetical protein
MTGSKETEEKLRDLEEKVRNARKVVRSKTASARDKADLRLLEQEAAGVKLSARDAKEEGPGRSLDSKLDKALKDTFPGSDPVSIVQAAPPKKGDKGSSAVPNSQKNANRRQNRR